MRKQRKNLTPHMIRRVAELYDNGVPIGAIGRQFDIHETTVCLIAKRAGLPRRRPKLPHIHEKI